MNLFSRPRRWWPAGRVGRVVVLAAGGGTAWALDHYVVDHVQIADVDAYEAAQAGSAPERGGEATVTGSTYASDDATVTISEHVTGTGSATVTPVNRGKGAALKTGFGRAGGEDVVCADADGQHRAGDILRVAAHVAGTGRTTLGVRRFTGAVPLRSSAGNALTRLPSPRSGPVPRAGPGWGPPGGVTPGAQGPHRWRTAPPGLMNG